MRKTKMKSLAEIREELLNNMDEVEAKAIRKVLYKREIRRNNRTSKVLLD